MSQNTEKQLELIRENGYELDFSTVFNEAFENYKKTALILGLVILILIIAFTVLVGSVAGVFYGIGSYTEFMTGLNPATQGSTTILISFLAAVIGAGLMAPLTAGLLKIVYLANKNEEFSFANAFDYYKSHYFKELFIAGIIISSVENILSTLLNLTKDFTAIDNTDILLSVVATIIGIFIYLFSYLTIPSIIFGNLKAVDAIKASFLLVRKNVFMIIALLIIGFVIAMLGLIGFCIGIFFTLPFMYALHFSIYTAALPIEEESEIDQIGNSEY